MQNEATYLDMSRRYRDSVRPPSASSSSSSSSSERWAELVQMMLRGSSEREEEIGRGDRAGGGAGAGLSSEGRTFPSTSELAAIQAKDPTLALLLPLLILLSTLLLLLIFFLVFLILLRRKRRRGIALSDHEGPIDLARQEEHEADGSWNGVEERWLEQLDDNTRIGYQRAKTWQQQYLPNSVPTDITLSQFLSIQEKGVSAWSFEPDYETNSPLYVTSRTEITFLEDGIGMAAEEGGACCVQSNLPLPRINEVYYWECKLFDKPENTQLAIGLSTKPYPSFRMPGWNRYSVGYFSADGFKAHNYPFTAQSYGPPLSEGDVLGVGYRPRTGAVFFTRNGKKLEDAYVGLTKHNLFPTVAANGAATVHVNLGQAGFVFIEANVKKWGLAPMIGTLAPPPAYGSERGSILLETATGPQSGGYSGHDGSVSSSPNNNNAANDHSDASAASPSSYNHHYQTSSQSQQSSRGQLQPQQLQPQQRQQQQQHTRQRSNEQLAVAALSNTDSSHEQGSSSSSSSSSRHQRSSSTSHRRIPSGSTVPIRPSPLRHTVTRQRTSSSSNSNASSPISIRGGRNGSSPPNERDEDDGQEQAGGGGGNNSEGHEGDDDDDEHLPHNPPTPGQLDISLRAMSPFSRRAQLEEEQEEREQLLSQHHPQQGGGGEQNEYSSSSPAPSAAEPTVALRAPSPPTSSTPPYHQLPPVAGRLPPNVPGDVSPPSYELLDANQYPAGVAEVMLSEMPQEHFSALFAAAHSANANRGAAGTSSSSRQQHSNLTTNNPSSGASSATGGASYENRTAFLDSRPRGGGNGSAPAPGNENPSSHSNATPTGLGLGLRGLLSGVWGTTARSSDSAEPGSTRNNDENV